MTTHDAATRERVAKAIAENLHGADWRSYLPTAAAALSALQPPPKEWAVSDDAEAGFRFCYDVEVQHKTVWKLDEGHRACRKAGLRGATPHLLRDLADGVSEEQAQRVWENVMQAGERDRDFGLRFLRALADTLEGRDGPTNRSES